MLVLASVISIIEFQELNQKTLELEKTKTDLNGRITSLTSKLATDVEVEKERCRTVSNFKFSYCGTV